MGFAKQQSRSFYLTLDRLLLNLTTTGGSFFVVSPTKFAFWNFSSNESPSSWLYQLLRLLRPPPPPIGPFLGVDEDEDGLGVSMITDEAVLRRFISVWLLYKLSFFVCGFSTGVRERCGDGDRGRRIWTVSLGASGGPLTMRHGRVVYLDNLSTSIFNWRE